MILFPYFLARREASPEMVGNLSLAKVKPHFE